MTTVQLTGRINLNAPGNYIGAGGGETPAGRLRRRSAGAVRPRQALMGMTSAVAARMEKSDTIADRLAGYGLCGLTLAYLAAQMLRTLAG